MMFDVPVRLVIAYGLIALMVLAAVVLVWWGLQNTDRERRRRERAKDLERYRRRDASAESDQLTTSRTRQ
jgi:hypothetical protein